MAGSVPVEIGDFEFFSFDMDLGVDLFGADVLVLTLDLDLPFTVREEGGVNVWFLF